jgi:hypothetical protein
VVGSQKVQPTCFCLAYDRRGHWISCAGPLFVSNMCSYTAIMATYALAGTPSVPSAFSAQAVTAPKSRSRSVAVPPPPERTLPVSAELAGLFPGNGLPRGGTVLLGPPAPAETLGSVSASGASRGLVEPAPGLTSLLLLLLAGASSQGCWCAVVGLPELGLVAAVEMGADLDRLVLVPRPGSEGRWQNVVTTLLETVDLVCLAPQTPVRPTDARRLSARARERRSTLLVFDAASAPGAARGILRTAGAGRVGRVLPLWPGPCDLRCSVMESGWSGLEHGHGLLSLRRLEAEVGGRGAASRPRRGRLGIPA